MTGRTGSVGDAWARLPKRVRTLALPVTVLLLVALYPNYYQDLFSALGGGTTGQLAPTVPTMVVMCVYVIMALGLNVVVGYAGLLDLGYVAFYAAGAYIAGWFATLQFAPDKIHFLSVGVLPVLPGLHFNVWLLLIVGAVFATILGIIIGLPTLRLRGDYLAIVTLGFGEIIPQAVNNGDDWFGHNITNGSRSTRPTTTTGPGSRSWCSRCSAASRCATRDSAGRGWRSARTRSQRRRWVSRSCARRRSRTRSARSSAGRPAASTRSSRARRSRRTSRSTSRSRCSAW
jgi:hypothetical protein